MPLILHFIDMFCSLIRFVCLLNGETSPSNNVTGAYHGSERGCLTYINNWKLKKKNPYLKDSFNVLDLINIYICVFCGVPTCSMVRYVGVSEEFAASIIIGEGSTFFGKVGKFLPACMMPHPNVWCLILQQVNISSTEREPHMPAHSG